MRKLLGVLVLLVAIVAAGATIYWAVFGQGLVRAIDQHRTVEESVMPVRYVKYVGDGTGGALWLDIGEKAPILFNLTPADAAVAAPHVGTTPKNELAISYASKVFVCGAIPTDSELAINIPGDDHATLTSRRSVINWPTWFEGATSEKPKGQWKRNWYYEFSWTHPSGALLRMRWRSEQLLQGGQRINPSSETARLSAVEIENK